MHSKKEMRSMIAEGMLAEAAAAAVEYATACAETENLNGFITLLADQRKVKEAWLGDLISFEELTRTQARITQGLLDRIDVLPDQPNRAAAKQRIPEQSYKWMVFGLFCTAKLLVFCFAFFVWQVHGFLAEEAITTFNALLPGLIVYGAIMFKDLFRSGLQGDTPVRYVSGKFKILAWVIFSVYAIAQVFLVSQKAYGNLTFTMMNLAIVGVEAGMGRFIAEIVEGVFKKEK